MTRYGLIGTGYWASEVHAAALAAHDEGSFVGVWGRSHDKSTALADRYDVQAFERPADLFAAVDVVSFAVPPDVQAPLAVEAVAAKCHLLLEKPLALDAAAADEVVDAVAANGVSSIVFFTSRFAPNVADWIARLQGPWVGGRATWFASISDPHNPFGSSPWRHREGALWDVGPHALSVLLPILGPVVDVTATPGPGDMVHLVLRHEEGASSTASVSLTVPGAAARFDAAVYGDAGWEYMPEDSIDPVAALERALAELNDVIVSGGPHPCDAAFGRDVVRILARASAQLPTAGL